MLLGRVTSACNAYDVHPSSRSTRVSDSASRPPPPSSAGKFAAYRPAAIALPRMSRGQLVGDLVEPLDQVLVRHQLAADEVADGRDDRAAFLVEPEVHEVSLSARRPADAHDVTDGVRPRQRGVRVADRGELARRARPASGRRGRSPCRRGRAAARRSRPASPVGSSRNVRNRCRLFGPTSRTCSGRVELVAEPGLPQVVQVGLGGVERVAGGAVVVVDPDVAEEGVRHVTDHHAGSWTRSCGRCSRASRRARRSAYRASGASITTRLPPNGASP